MGSPTRKRSPTTDKATSNCSDLWGSTGHQASHRGAAKHGICFASRLVPSNVNSYGYDHIPDSAWYATTASYDEPIRLQPEVAGTYHARGTALLYSGDHQLTKLPSV